MKWKRAKKLMLCAMAVLTGASALSITQPQTVEAATPAWSDPNGSSYNTCFSHFEDFGEPRMNYRAFYADGYEPEGSQGSTVYGHLNNGYSDGSWLYAIGVANAGTGHYQNMGNIGVRAHVHNLGWTGVYANGVNGLSFKPNDGWIEAIQLQGTDELAKYAYIQYQAICNPVSPNEVRLHSGGHFDADAWDKGQRWAKNLDGTYRQFFSNSQGAVYEKADYKHFNMAVQGNWAGTAGYSMPMFGFAAMMKDYPCRVYINPNGGQWAGATNTVQVGQNGENTAVRAGDAITFRTDALPTRAGYEFAGWDVSYTPYSYFENPIAETYYQSPSIDIIPNVCSGDGSEVHNDINMQPIYHLPYESHQSFDFSAVYNYQYYRNKYPDLRAAFGNNEELYFQHFLNNGMVEGRQGCANFNVFDYKKRYGDLQTSFGNDLRLYYFHYMLHGYSEGRFATTQDSRNLSYTICAGNVYNVTLTARWVKKITDYTLTFDTNRPTNPLSCHEPYCNESGRTIRYGQKYGTCVTNGTVYAKSLPTPTLEGYRFDGWYTAKTGGTKVDDNTIYNINGNSTLYAHWSDSDRSVAQNRR